MDISKNNYNWKRFWCLREDTFSLYDYGYLYDPESKHGQAFNPNLLSLYSVLDNQCLALLGEPGIGKTRTLDSEKENIEERILSEGDRAIWMNLRSYGSEVRLIQNLFESREFSSWKNGNHNLHIFLDSFDECLLSINTLAALLLDEFHKYPVKRLFLRIACRTAEWPASLESGIVDLWGNHAFKAYELVPLRKKDVEEAAKLRGINTSTFLEEIDTKKAVPFAIKPITLEFLMNIYLKNGQFPSAQSDLYQEGCKLLCHETNPDRISSGHTGNLNTEQRLAIASRIAALTIFCNKNAIWTGPDLGHVPDEDITVKDLYGGKEHFRSNRFDVTKAAIEETLSTGLFSSRGINRIGWAHQTYADFLSAHYLKQNKLTLSQIMSIIVSPDDVESRVVPQLQESAAWMGVKRADIFSELSRIDPQLLLKNDVSIANEKDKKALVENLLGLFEKDKLLYQDLDLRDDSKNINHPELAKQLCSYINDSSRGIVARLVALDIAELCNVKTLQNDLVNIALDSTDDLSVRERAVYVIGKIADEDIKAKLKPLVEKDIPEDQDDDIKGAVLKVIWPQFINGKKMFNILTPPKRIRHYGSYLNFISKDITFHINPSDLPMAIKWIESLEPINKHERPYWQSADLILLKALKNIDIPQVAEAFARFLFSRLKNCESMFRKPEEFQNLLDRDISARKKLIEALVKLIKDPKNETSFLVFGEIKIATKDDISWLIEKIRVSRSEEDQMPWAELIAKVFYIEDSKYFDVIVSACQQYAVLKNAMSFCIEYVELNSERANLLRSLLEKSKKRSEPKKKRFTLDPPPDMRIKNELNKFEKGDVNAWWRLNLEMTLNPDSKYYSGEDNPDLLTFPGWISSDDNTRTRIVNAAKEYIYMGNPDTSKWPGTNKLYRSAIFGYRALRLIQQKDVSFIKSLNKDVWQKWTPVILNPWTFVTEDEILHNKLIFLAYKHAPDSVIKTLLLLIDIEYKCHGHMSNHTKTFEALWDQRIATSLLKKIRDNTLDPEYIRELLKVLLKHDNYEAMLLAESFVKSHDSADEHDKSRSIATANALITSASDAGWPILWPIIQKNNQFGRKLLENMSLSLCIEQINIKKCLTEEEIADLYIWLVQQYPYSEDPYHEDVYTPGPRDRIADFRNRALTTLENAGTPTVCTAIKRIIQTFPNLEWLKRILLRAQAQTRKMTWMPPTPKEFLELVENRESRFVQNEEQLIEVIIDSLKRLETKLHGETPAAIDLWNEIDSNIYKPRDENRLSDYVKRHIEVDIKDKGIIINREVEIRRGQKTDIKVDAILFDKDREPIYTISIIIETKGCWHSDLKTAMENQLVNRYLKDYQCRFGIYLVGWFFCEKWDEKDYRKKRTPNMRISEARKFFDDQACELSKDDKTIKAFVMDARLKA